MQLMKTLGNTISVLASHLAGFFGPGPVADQPHPVAEAMTENAKATHDMLANHEQRLRALEGKPPAELPLLADGNQGHSIATLQGD